MMNSPEDKLEIISMVTTWCESADEAIFWYSNEPIPALGNMTPEKAIQLGHAQAVEDYLQGLMLGGYA